MPVLLIDLLEQVPKEVEDRVRATRDRARAVLRDAIRAECRLAMKTDAEGSDYRVTNGILLRTAIHTLFDRHLLGIEATLRVHLKDSIRSSEFARFHGKRIETLPASTLHQPSPLALQDRFQRFLAASS